MVRHSIVGLFMLVILYNTCEEERKKKHYDDVDLQLGSIFYSSERKRYLNLRLVQIKFKVHLAKE